MNLQLHLLNVKNVDINGELVNKLSSFIYMSNFNKNYVQRYVLLELNQLNSKVIGIYNYIDAVKKKDSLQLFNNFNKYVIQGPFDVETKEEEIFDIPQINPIFPDTNKPLIIKSPRLKLKNPFEFP
jgi:hypothetical protein